MPPINSAPSLTLEISTTPLETDWRLGTISTRDPDGDIAVLSLSGDDADAFTLRDNGELVFSELLDFETPSDLNGDNIFNLTVTADDGLDGVTSKDLEFEIIDVPNDAFTQILGSPQGLALGKSLLEIPAVQYGGEGALVVTTQARRNGLAQSVNVAAHILPAASLGTETNSSKSVGPLGLTITSASSGAFGYFNNDAFLGTSSDHQTYLGLFHIRSTDITTAGGDQLSISILLNPNEDLIGSFGGELNLMDSRLPAGVLTDRNNAVSIVPPGTNARPLPADFNGDGVTDLIFRDTQIGGNTQSATFVSGVFGVAQNAATVFDIGMNQLQAGRVIELLPPFWSIEGWNSYTMDNMGDFDADGADDLVLLHSNNETESSAKLFISGKNATDTLLTRFDILANASDSIDRMFWHNLDDDYVATISNSGDVDGDGFDDVLLTTYSPWGYSYPSYLILSENVASRNMATEWIPLGSNKRGFYGPSTGFIIEDIDGDDRAEIVLSNGINGGSEGRLVIIPGNRLSGDGFDPIYTLQNISYNAVGPLELPEGVVEILFPNGVFVSSQGFGYSIAQVNDLDGDGFKEIVISNPYFDASPENSDNHPEGAIYLVPTRRIRTAAETGEVIDLRSVF